MSLVLIVEDNTTFRNALRDLLVSRFPSIGVDVAGNGDEALLKVRDLSPHLIFMDLKLPGRNGLELTRTIKSANPEIEIIILTSYDIPEYREAALRNGASHFLTKGNAGSDHIANVVASTLASKGLEPASPKIMMVSPA
jgi:DNA-binding NarL/FixJ family response regulator